MKFTMGIVGSFTVIAGGVTISVSGTYWTVPNYHTLVAYCEGPGGSGGGGAPGGANNYTGNTGNPGSGPTEFYSTTPLIGYPGQGGTPAYCGYSFWWNGYSEQYSYWGANGTVGAAGAASGGDTNTSGGGQPGGAGGAWGYVGGIGGAGGIAVKTWTLGQTGAPVPHSLIYVVVGAGGICPTGGVPGAPGSNGFVYLQWS